MQNRRPARLSHNKAVGLLHMPTIGYITPWSESGSQPIAAEVGGRTAIFSPITLRVQCSTTPPPPPNPVVCFQIQVK